MDWADLHSHLTETTKLMKEYGVNSLILTLSLTLSVMLAAGCASEESVEQEVSRQKASYRVSAYQLYEDYAANEIAADKKYKKMILEVSGDVVDIGKGATGTIYIALQGDPHIGVVKCFFSKNAEDKIAGISKGQYVTIKGKCSGKMINMLLSGCMLYL
jgi:hypothetical protein